MIRRFEQLLREELERAQIQRTEQLPPHARSTSSTARCPAGRCRTWPAVHRVVAQLKRRLKTQGQESRGRKRHAHVDVRRTMRASLNTGGVPGRAQVPARAAAAPGDLRAVRRVDVRDERERLLPLRAARAARLVSQDALRSSSSSASAR
jgi:uncharacterized protein with von Willebrand factor type A (vWA) domain